MKNQHRRAVPGGPIIPQGTLAHALRHMPDPRQPYGWNPQHPPLPLVSLLLLTIVALLCGANSQSAIAQWGRERQEDQPALLMALGFPPGQSPSGVTLHRLFRRLDVDQFEKIVVEWLMQTGVTATEPVALDGQTLRAVAASDVPASHVLSVYAPASAAVIARIVMPNKGHEQPALDRAVQQIPLAGRLVTFDALHTHRDVCATLAIAGATCLAPIKANQPTLYAEVQEIFRAWPQGAGAPPAWLCAEIRQAGGQWDEAITAPPKPQHGRQEWRRICVWRDPRWANELGATSPQGERWATVRQLIRVERRRCHLRRHQVIKVETEVVYFLSNDTTSASTVAQQIRQHWQIENQLHRQRDVLFDQDRSTVRVATAPHAMMACRDLVLTLLHRWQIPNAAAARRTWSARPHLAVHMVLSLC